MFVVVFLFIVSSSFEFEFQCSCISFNLSLYVDFVFYVSLLNHFILFLNVKHFELLFS